MNVDIVVPEDMWEEDTEAVVTTWLYDDGAAIKKGDLVAEIMTEKVQFEIFAPADGILQITKAVDDVVTKGSVLGTIQTS